LAEWLCAKGYQVFGLVRKESWEEPNNASNLVGKIEILFGNMSEELDITSAIECAHPHEIYNLAAQSRPGESWKKAAATLEVNALGAIWLFEAVRRLCPESRVYHASSSEMFGRVSENPQNEQTPFIPMNPYAAAKVYAHQMARIYRESYGLYIATGILFNHESERRPLHFVVQKIAYGAACAALGIKYSLDLNERGRPIVEHGRLALGSLDVARDWGYAGDFVQAMWLILQQDCPDDFVVGTGQVHTLRELCTIAYNHVGKNWLDHVVTDPSFVRPLETVQTVADPTKAREILGWRPTVCFEDMVKKMVNAQITHLKPKCVLKFKHFV
jgi:GDPmannose 4,6-dehydratase